MLPGLNHNIRYRELVLHVQTEDSGQPRATLTTHVFHGGTVVAHEQSSYAANPEAKSADVVRKLMQDQHRRTLKQVTGGQYDAVLRSRGILGDDPLSVLDALPPEIVTVTSAAASPFTSLPAGATSVPPREGFGPMSLGPAGLGRPSQSGGVAAPDSLAATQSALAPPRDAAPESALAPQGDAAPKNTRAPLSAAAASASAPGSRVAQPRAPSGLPGLAELPLESLSNDLVLSGAPGASADLPSGDLGRVRSRRPATRPASRTGSTTESLRPATAAPAPRTSLAPPPPSTAGDGARDASDQTLLDLPPVQSWSLSRPPPLPRPSTPVASDEAIELSGPVEGVDLASLPPLPPYPSMSAPPLASAWGEADAETPFRPTPSPPSRLPIPDAATVVDDSPPFLSWRPPQATTSDRVIPGAPGPAPARPRPPPGASEGAAPSPPASASLTGASTNSRLPPPPPLTMPRPSTKPLVEGLGSPKPGVTPGPTPRLPPRHGEPNRGTSNASAAPRPPPAPPGRSPAGSGPGPAPGPPRVTPPSNLVAPPTPRPGSAAPPASARAPWPPGSPPNPSATPRRPAPVSSSGVGAPSARPAPAPEPRAPSVARTAEPRAASTQRPAEADGATQRTAPARSASAVRRVEERSLDDIILGYLTKRPPGSGGGS